MNRRDEVRERIDAIRAAARAGEAPPIDPAAVAVLRNVIGPDDPLRLYQLAEGTVIEVYVSGAVDESAAHIVAEQWTAHVAWTVSITGSGPVPLLNRLATSVERPRNYPSFRLDLKNRTRGEIC
jgi:hypothetical protein